MKSKKIVSSILLGLLSLGFSAQQTSAASKSPVSVVNGNIKFSTKIPANLSWGQTSLEAATQAIDYQTSEIETAITKLTAKGAIKVTKTFVKTPTGTFPDWKNYVPTFSQYILSGLDATGKVLGRSIKIPSDSANLANRLVYLRQSECIPAGQSSNSTLPTCSATKPKQETYLRAALRTASGNGQLEDIGGFIYQQLYTCLGNKKPFTIKAGVFDCPSNAKIFGGNRSFPVKGNFATRSYSIAFSPDKRSATLTYSALNYKTIALTGRCEDGSVVRFG
ncbi:MAG: hypothetical protein RL146_256 [Actinomycetota bacterium]|jgi:hypothetical protein